MSEKKNSLAHDAKHEANSVKKHDQEVKGYVDPGWPKLPSGEHAVTEIIAHTNGALSPFGDIQFPVDPASLPYVHPYTRINK